MEISCADHICDFIAQLIEYIHKDVMKMPIKDDDVVEFEKEKIPLTFDLITEQLAKIGFTQP